MNMARNAVASFRPIGTEADRALIDECNSTRGGSFIVLPLSDERRETEAHAINHLSQLGGVKLAFRVHCKLRHKAFSYVMSNSN
jgi:hypothetical protein